MVLEYLQQVSAGHAERARAGIARSMANLWFDPARFAARLSALSRRPHVIDSIALARRALDWLPPGARALRAVRRHVLSRLHVTMALECSATGFGVRAAQHLLSAMRQDPALVLRRRYRMRLVHQILRRPPTLDRALSPEVARIFAVFAEHGVQACVVGSLAISLHAGHSVKVHGDIDLDVPSARDHEKALALLTGPLNYQTIELREWQGLDGMTATMHRLVSPSGVRIELAYMSDWPVEDEHIILINNVRVSVIGLRELRRTYATFHVLRNAAGPARWASKHAILAIDRLLGGPPTLELTS